MTYRNGCLIGLVWLVAFFGGLAADSRPVKLAAVVSLGLLSFYHYLRGPFGLRPDPEIVMDPQPGLLGALERLFEALHAPLVAVSPFDPLSLEQFRPEARHVIIWMMVTIQVMMYTFILDLRPLFIAIAAFACLVCRLAVAERRVEDLRTVLATHLKNSRERTPSSNGTVR